MSIGIYKITSPSGKIYIGQSVNIKSRKNNYSKKMKKTIGPKLLHSLNKYSFEAHKFDIIQECPINELNQWEIHWKIYYLAQVQGDWNKVLFCDLYDLGGGPKSEETKRKIGLGNKGKTLSKEHKQILKDKSKNNKYALGNKFTYEQRQKITNAKKGHICYQDPKRKEKISEKNKGLGLGIKKSNETKLKMSNSKTKFIEQYDLEENFIKEWSSTKEASNILKINSSRICGVCKGRFNNAGGFKWKYKI